MSGRRVRRTLTVAWVLFALACVFSVTQIGALDHLYFENESAFLAREEFILLFDWVLGSAFWVLIAGTVLAAVARRRAA